MPSSPAVPPKYEHLPDLPPVPLWNSRDLLGGAKEALIQHDGAVYRLRLTGQGKLILTK